MIRRLCARLNKTTALLLYVLCHLTFLAVIFEKLKELDKISPVDFLQTLPLLT